MAQTTAVRACARAREMTPAPDGTQWRIATCREAT